MKCQVCGNESGKYPLCRSCNILKEQGVIIKCNQCHKWHYRNAPCSMRVYPAQSAAVQERTSNVSNSDNDCNKETFLYEPKYALMTKTEQNFYRAITAALPDGYYVYPQVNLAAFIQRTDGARFQNELYRNIDFLITTKTFVPKLAIEINDRTHMDVHRRERDLKVRNILEEAGIPLLTLWTSYGINTEYIQCKILELLVAPVSRKHHFGQESNPIPRSESQPYQPVLTPVVQPVPSSTYSRSGCTGAILSIVAAMAAAAYLLFF